MKVGVLAGSLLAAAIAGGLLRSRNRAYRRVRLEESVDSDVDGVPDAFEEDAATHGGQAR